MNLACDQVGEFLEKEENLINFVEEQLEKIESHIKYRHDSVAKESKSRKDFENKECASNWVMLVKNALLFNARGQDGIIEISMTSSEFKSSYGLKGIFAVIDSQNECWQI